MKLCSFHSRRRFFFLWHFYCLHGRRLCWALIEMRVIIKGTTHASCEHKQQQQPSKTRKSARRRCLSFKLNENMPQRGFSGSHFFFFLFFRSLLFLLCLCHSHWFIFMSFVVVALGGAAFLFNFSGPSWLCFGSTAEFPSARWCWRLNVLHEIDLKSNQKNCV